MKNVADNWRKTMTELKAGMKIRYKKVKNGYVDMTEGKEYILTKVAFTSGYFFNDIGEERIVHQNKFSKYFDIVEEKMNIDNSNDWKVGDEFVIQNEYCQNFPDKFTKDKVYEVLKVSSKHKNINFKGDDGQNYWLPIDEISKVIRGQEYIPNAINLKKNELNQKLEYLGLSQIAKDDIQNLINEIIVIATNNGENKFREKLNRMMEE